jgi:AmpD protein
MSSPHDKSKRNIQIDSVTGEVIGARQVTSPNFDARPDGMPIELIVVHGICLPPNEFGGPWIEALFLNQLPWDKHPYFKQIEGLIASTHLLIRRDGELVQYVSLNQRAWHAGKSNFQGRERCNDFSIGIELEGADEIPYEPIQYEVLAETVSALCDAYPTLSADRIVGHSDIAPGRKTDPGPAFDWARLKAILPASR